MKTYQTWEVIKMLTENPKLVFADDYDDTGFIENIKGDIFFYYKDSVKERLELSKCQLESQWTLVQRPVSFMEAVKSPWKIKYEKWNYYQTLSRALELLSDESEDVQRKMIEGNWFIEEAPF